MTMEKALPEGWSSFTLNDISHLPGGKTPSKSNPEYWNDGNILWVSPKDMKTPTISDSGDKITEQAVTKGGMAVYPKSSILFVVRSGILKHSFPVAVTKNEVTINQDLKAITPVNGIDTKFLFQLLRAFSNQILGSCSKAGTTVNSIDLEALGKLQLPLPPLAEQQVIADKLDALLAQVATTKIRLERVPETIKRFRQSVLAAAVSGKLTEGWRGSKPAPFAQPPITIGQEKSDCPDGWEWNKLIDLARLESGHTPRKSIQEYWEGGDVPWISLQDIRAAHGTVIAKTKFMPTRLGIENSSARLLPKGTVCFSRDISVGYTTIMGAEMATTQHFVNWICTEELNNHYLMYAFMAAKDHLTISGQGTTVKTLYMPACKQFRLLTPPLPEQQEIVRRVEELFTHADAVEQQAKAALEKVNNLTQSILAKAFRGELTADWRAANPELISGENSAEALLARIREERAAQKPKKRATTRRKKKAVSD